MSGTIRRKEKPKSRSHPRTRGRVIVRGAGGGAERGPGRGGGGAVGGRRPPGGAAPAGHQRVHDVVAPRDPREHLADGARGLAFYHQSPPTTDASTMTAM